ncbi:MAG: tetratricopeptide repeat protein, partial [Verrucomicrobiota bacterium]|nr:tetratricopeptide repeat protein [Verrucomicrobiota bacterium]
MDFLAELKRRNVYKVAVTYTVISWLLIQAASILFPTFDAPSWLMKALVTLLTLGFLLALIIAWAFEMTPQGMKRTEDLSAEEIRALPYWSARKFAAVIASIAVMALALLVYQVAGRHWLQLERIASEAASSAQSISDKSIAVLPFQNLSSEAENAFFTDGVQDEILTTLAKVAELRVISRTSVMQYKDPEKRNLKEIAQALNTAHVLEGSVQRSGHRVRVTAQLIDARTDTHLWAQQYDRELADVFAIQSEIAQKIAQELRAALSPNEKAAIEARPTTDMVAYDLYLRAKGISVRQTSPRPEQVQEAIKLLDQAVARDPHFVPALCALVNAHLWIYFVAFDQTPARLELATRALDAAALLQPNAGEVHLARAFYHYWGKREYDAALAELALARRALPNDPDVVYLTATVQRRKGKWGEATHNFESAAALDPRNSNLQLELGGIYFQQRRYPEAAQVLDRALAQAPNDFGLQSARANVDLAERGNLRRMQAVLTGDATKTANPARVAFLRMQLALDQRDYRAAHEALAANEAKEMNPSAGYVVPREWFEGLIALGLDDRPQAQTSFLAARESAATRVAARPNEAIPLSVVAQIDARLGRKEDAISEAERALELHAPTGDELQACISAVRLASICGQVGETDRALGLLEQTAKLPGGPSYGELKLREEWDPLRSHPRSQRLSRRSHRRQRPDLAERRRTPVAARSGG